MAARHRDTRGTGLCELFCEYDTGHDNSPRCKGMPHACPGQDAAVCPDAPGLPLPRARTSRPPSTAAASPSPAWRAPSAATDEAAEWDERAEAIRRAIMEHCYDPEDACFYDVDAAGQFVRIRSDVL